MARSEASVGTQWSEPMVRPICQPTAADSSPPVIILSFNVSYTGLGVARCLAGRGMRVVGLSAGGGVFGNFSRSYEVRFAPDSANQPEELAKFLLQATNELAGAVIFPTADFDILFLDRFRSELEAHYRLVIPSHECLQQVLDKHALVSKAIQAAVPVPRTVVVRSANDLDRVPTQAGFPCVMKPIWAYHWRQTGAWEKVGGRKAIPVANMEELRREYQRVATVRQEVLIQELILGGPEQLASACGYVNEKSEPLAYFTARIIFKHPDHLGTGCLVENEDIPELLEPTLRLWRALDYKGFADVEYKRDSRTGEWKLIEINTRPWWWHELGTASGANLSWVAYCHLTGRRVAPIRKQIVPTKWIAEDALLYFFLRGIYHREIRLRSFWKKFSGRRIYGVFAWNNPWPFFRCLFAVTLPNIASQFLAKVWNRKRMA